MSDIIALHAIGTVVGGRNEATDDDWDKVEAAIALDSAQFGREATAGLGDFSHIEVVFHFDRRTEARESMQREVRTLTTPAQALAE